MSCIYGPRQFGTEDQGWVAHFLLRALAGEPITLFGDGMQVRDILFVDDLVDAFLLAERHIDRLAGRAFNIGGGPGNVISLLDLLDQIEALEGRRPELDREDWRTGDQRYYVSDTRSFQQATGWAPRIGAARASSGSTAGCASCAASPARDASRRARPRAAATRTRRRGEQRRRRNRSKPARSTRRGRRRDAGARRRRAMTSPSSDLALCLAAKGSPCAPA